MLSSTFVLTAESFSRLFVPVSKSGLRRYYSVVPISQIPLRWEEWLDVNARESTIKGRVPKAIRQTLIDNPEWFAEYNRGLTIVASQIKWNNKTKELTLVFKDREFNGVLDGGHTLHVILDQLKQVSNGEQASLEGYCNLEIFTGLDQEDIPNVVEARNTSKQVASKSLMNLEGRFDDLKNAIGRGRTDLISWKENEGGEQDVREVIGMLTALDKGSFSDNNHPIAAYSGKETCLKRFASDEHSAKYKKLLRIAPDILEMWDSIQYYLPDQYNATGGKFGKLSGVKVLKRAKDLPFIGKTTGYDIPTGYIYPILASFRAMLEEHNGDWIWGKHLKPQELIADGLADQIFEGSVRHSITNYHNANRTGKDNQAWHSAYQAARIFYLEQP